MRVLHASYSFNQGGAATAARRLCEAQFDLGLEVETLAMSNSSLSLPIPQYRTGGRRHTVRGKVENNLLTALRLNDQNPRSLGLLPSDVPRMVKKLDPDVLQLHWMGASSIAGWQARRLATPTVWRLPDLWPVAGSLHYPISPQLPLDRKARTAFASQWTRRSRALEATLKRLNGAPRVNIRLIATSPWMQQQIREEMARPGIEITEIPNAVPTHIFQPGSRDQARLSVGLEVGRPLVGFLSTFDASSIIKGAHLLPEIMQVVRQRVPDALLATLDKSAQRTRSEAARHHFDSVISLPFTASESTLAAYYQSFDIVIVPSIIDAFNQVAAEAMSCGIPIVAFDNSGPGSLIQQETTGLKVKAFDTEEFGQSVAALLEDLKARDEMGLHARRVAENLWSYTEVAKHYDLLYQELLTGSK